MRRWLSKLLPSNLLPCRETSSLRYCCASSISYCGYTLATSAKASRGGWEWPCTPKRKWRMRLEQQLDFWKRRQMRCARWTVGSFLELVLLMEMPILRVVTRCFWKLWKTDLEGREYGEFYWFELHQLAPGGGFYYETEAISDLWQELRPPSPFFYPPHRNSPTKSYSWGVLGVVNSLRVQREPFLGYYCVSTSGLIIIILFSCVNELTNSIITQFLTTSI